MTPFIITTKYQLKAWLDENGWFEFGNIVDLSPLPVPRDEALHAVLLSTCISDTNGGLMIFGIKETAIGFRVKFDFWNGLGEREAPLWTTLVKVFATLFPTSQVLCGNCRLTAEQWLAALEQGQPYLNSLFIKE